MLQKLRLGLAPSEVKATTLKPNLRSFNHLRSFNSFPYDRIEFGAFNIMSREVTIEKSKATKYSTDHNTIQECVWQLMVCYLVSPTHQTDR